MIINENRTDSYIATVNLKDPGDQEWIKAIRKAVREANAFYKERGQTTRKYVKLQGRGHRMGVYRYHQSLPLKFSETADVYVYNRNASLDY
jgi:hypothetical protein